MKALKLIGIIIVFLLFNSVSNAQSIQLTIGDNNFMPGETYTVYVAVYDYSASPTLVWTTYPTSPITYYAPGTYTIPITYQVSKDVTAYIYQMAVLVIKNTKHYPGTSFLLNSDGYYAGSTPISVVI
jgi:hypothetical protein